MLSKFARMQFMIKKILFLELETSYLAHLAVF